MKKYVYMFKEGDASMRNLLGGKGANLAEMSRLGLPVPQGFTITTEACNEYYAAGAELTTEMIEQIFAAMTKMEEITGKKFGDLENPLLVSVRSGARASMPGMMDTILNLGLNREVVKVLAEKTKNPRFAYDSYRRFIMMFSDVVMEIEKSNFEAKMDELKERLGVDNDTDLGADAMAELADAYLRIYEKIKGEPFPENPKEQLLLSIAAVFRSWNNDRAIYYRRMHNLPSSWGTAVNVQEMVYGNMGDTSGTGVAFSRNPATGENVLYGEYLMNAQGEDVVAGVRTPQLISQLKEQMPDIYYEFERLADELERHYGDMQDLEFTIEEGKLFILQTRGGKRTATAALQVAVDMVAEGIISKEKALDKIDPNSLDTLLHPTFRPEVLEQTQALAGGLPASPGAAAGEVVFTADEAYEAHQVGRKVILVRTETSPEDIQGMNVSEGILTSRGGMTSHAAVVARGMGKCCVTGCSEALIDEDARTMTIGDKVFTSGDWISLDGTSGKVYEGELATQPAEISKNFATIMDWSDEIRQMGIRTNADTPADADRARELGAEGIGLCRTEHMFFGADRIFAFRQMIVARTEEARRAALAVILPIQRADFEGIFRSMDGLPVTIRLLDPPLHEFLPTAKGEIRELAAELGFKVETLEAIINELHEINPMLGHRGCRLAISYPEIAEMQTEAIIGAAINVMKEGITVKPEIMIPLVAEVKEFEFVKETVIDTAERVLTEAGQKINYLVGTMIEIPRACLTADKIAQKADFFSFGTNDLTQMGFGLSRDDAGKILDAYYKNSIFESDPTAHLDREGVGMLMEIATKLGRKANPQIHLGICGEHGGDPVSVEFCHLLGFDYVSCSPYRVPIARLAAAQAAMHYPNAEKEILVKYDYC
ncbi:MAG: pyruvate, phosphate dikinase [Saccharofermentanales bacterium]|jgi:pyruvate,orthophosphate dikinase